MPSGKFWNWLKAQKGVSDCSKQTKAAEKEKSEKKKKAKKSKDDCMGSAFVHDRTKKMSQNGTLSQRKAYFVSL